MGKAETETLHDRFKILEELDPLDLAILENSAQTLKMRKELEQKDAENKAELSAV